MGQMRGVSWEYLGGNDREMWLYREIAVGNHRPVFRDSLTLLVVKTTFYRIDMSIPWLLIPWLLASPGHQQPWYQVHMIDGCFVSKRRLKNDFFSMLAEKKRFKFLKQEGATSSIGSRSPTTAKRVTVKRVCTCMHIIMLHIYIYIYINYNNCSQFSKNLKCILCVNEVNYDDFMVGLPTSNDNSVAIILLMESELFFASPLFHSVWMHDFVDS